MTYHVLQNPKAGNGTAFSASRLDGIGGADASVVLHDITTITDYAAFFASLSREDAVILCGGDGTLNRFINDTDGLEIHQELLYLPAGSGNDFLRDINRQVTDDPFPVKPYLENLPYVEVKGKRYRFLNNVGFGIDGYCCEVGDRLRAARKPGDTSPVNYAAIAIKGLLFHYKPTNATVTVDGREYRYPKAWLAPAMKGRYYGGGMMATPAQDRANPEGLLSVMLFYGKGRLATLLAFPSIFKGEHIKRAGMVAIHSGREIKVTFDAPRAVQIDGETITGVTEYTAYAACTVTEAAGEKATSNAI